MWLLTNPEVAGYVINPISVYYCHAAASKGGALDKCIAEVCASVSLCGHVALKWYKTQDERHKARPGYEAYSQLGHAWCSISASPRTVFYQSGVFMCLNVVDPS